MRTALKAAVNIAATGGLTLWVMTWIAWVPGVAVLFNAAMRTPAWQALRDADSWLRLSLGATIGPESNDMMMVWCCVAMSFAMALAIVWAANRGFRRLARVRGRDTSRAARVA